MRRVEVVPYTLCVLLVKAGGTAASRSTSIVAFELFTKVVLRIGGEQVLFGERADLVEAIAEDVLGRHVHRRPLI